MTDRRSRRSDEAVRAAFLRLLFSVRYETISMSRIAAEADVSRSTLYQHYDSREAILRATMDRLLDDLAGGITGTGDPASLDRALRHFWDNRRLARSVFGPPVDAQVRRWLADKVEAQLLAQGRGTVDARIVAVKRSAGAVMLLEQWLTGHLDAPIDAIASGLTPDAR